MSVTDVSVLDTVLASAQKLMAAEEEEAMVVVDAGEVAGLGLAPLVVAAGVGHVIVVAVTAHAPGLAHQSAGAHLAPDPEMTPVQSLGTSLYPLRRQERIVPRAVTGPGLGHVSQRLKENPDLRAAPDPRVRPKADHHAAPRPRAGHAVALKASPEVDREVAKPLAFPLDCTGLYT